MLLQEKNCLKLQMWGKPSLCVCESWLYYFFYRAVQSLHKAFVIKVFFTHLKYFLVSK